MGMTLVSSTSLHGTPAECRQEYSIIQPDVPVFRVVRRSFISRNLPRSVILLATVWSAVEGTTWGVKYNM